MKRFILLSNPRTGSTYLHNLLRGYPGLDMAAELLNSENQLPDNLKLYFEEEMHKTVGNIIGFKLICSQLEERKITFNKIIEYFGPDFVIVLWRKSVIDQYCSLMIAKKTGVWFWYPSAKNTAIVESIALNDQEIKGYFEDLVNDWQTIGNQWPIHLTPIYICYEDLIADPMNQLKRIFSAMALDMDLYKFKTTAGMGKKPIPNKQKISNWSEISETSKNLELNVEEILKKSINQNLLAQCSNLPFLPDSEPTAPIKGWIYNVCKPFMPNKGKNNTMEALASGSVSSASVWPKQLSVKLKQIFEVPVAQPCSNGFTALYLSMQTIGITTGDEVIMPSLTMIAVPNAVRLVGGIPVFADSASDDYNPGLKEIVDASSGKTRAVVLTHTYGVPTPDLELIVIECQKRDWILIEDISECVGVNVKTSCGQQLLGTFGQLAAASLYANKIVHSGDGGFVLARDVKHGTRLKSLVNHGFTTNYHFLHFESAINAKMNGLGAAMACGCFDEMALVLDHRHLLSQWYRQSLKGLPICLMPECGPNDTPWVFGIECTSQAIRTQLRSYLAGYGIETRDYFFPLHLQPAFKYLLTAKSYSRAEALGSTGFYLPTYYDLRKEDIVFITDVIKEYFNGKESETNELIPPFLPINESLTLKSGSFKLEVNRYTRSGHIDQSFFRDHPLIHAISHSLMANNLLITDNWSGCQEFIQSVNKTIKKSKYNRDIEYYFKPYLEYFSTFSSFEPSVQRPWIYEDLKAPEYEIRRSVATTTDEETLQILVWIIKLLKPRYILELGSWMGHSSLVMAIAAKTYEHSDYKAHIYACDAFAWQHWMSNYVYSIMNITSGQSFLQRFLSNTKPMNDFIEPIVSQINEQFSDKIKDIKPDLVFMDWTQESKDLDMIWRQIEPNLIPGKTVIVFNGLSITALPFLTKQSNKLKSLAKPHTIAKVYLYAPKGNTSDHFEGTCIEGKDSECKLNFKTLPDWRHHHKNAFNYSINALKSELHDENANIVFIPAVEETLCDNPDVMLNNQWIGIIHMTIDFPEVFYVPDLRRLCGKRYHKYMKNCFGLFTLTTVQSEYLNNNLQLGYKIPVQPLTCPFISPERNGESVVIDLLQNQKKVEIILIGSFARDYTLFGSAVVPKSFKKVILINDKNNNELTHQNHIEMRERLSDDEYEQLLYRCIPFLCLKYDGAANTLILECIARNIPILVPNMRSCVEYIGENYPLLYSLDIKDFTELLDTKNIESAIDYLKALNKSRFQTKTFINSVKTGIVLKSIAEEVNQTVTENLISPRHQFNQFDVTLFICSYKRTHHLSKILDSLWNRQTFRGKYEIIVWNNNILRNGFVNGLCNPYVIQNNDNKSLELISSTKNYFCSVRLSMPQLMRSQCLLICDDDCIPGPQFIQFFMDSHNKYPKDILCLRGHQFFDHKLDVQNPIKFWTNYEYLRFKSDETPERFIHFVHADTCLVPKSALQECASIPMPDPSFALVDDYWMSYVLNHKFGRNLRKLSAKHLDSALVERTEDSDQKGLALYTRPDVMEARNRMYIHHMLQGWPVWAVKSRYALKINDENIKRLKSEFWDKLFVGYNISSKIDESGIAFLASAGVKCVRIGAVGLGDRVDYEFKEFLSNPLNQMKELNKTLSLLKSRDIRVVLTLCPQLSGTDVWRLIAENLYSDEFIVGYDLINEPFTQYEDDCIKNDIDPGHSQLTEAYIKMIKAIRQVDQTTPIIVEPSFWANIKALNNLSLDQMKAIDGNILVSFHFYCPQVLTQRRKNQNRYSFPSEVTVYENSNHTKMTIDQGYIRTQFETAINWSRNNKTNLMLGEFGISRDVKGAVDYLNCIINTCIDLGISCFVYSFRDEEWDSMDYELGTDINSGINRLDLNENILMQNILKAIKFCNELID